MSGHQKPSATPRPSLAGSLKSHAELFFYKNTLVIHHTSNVCKHHSYKKKKNSP